MFYKGVAKGGANWAQRGNGERVGLSGFVVACGPSVCLFVLIFFLLLIYSFFVLFCFVFISYKFRLKQ